MVDDRLVHFGDPLVELLSKFSVTISCDTKSTVYGRSWEMACCMCLAGRRGVFSGELISLTSSIHSINLRFGEVPFMGIKQKGTKTEILTSEDIPNIAVLM